MLVARALVLGVNARAVLAVAIVAMSVAYALLSGAAAGGLRDASAALSADLLEPRLAVHAPGLAPFDAARLPPGATGLAHARSGDLVLGTQRPWPHANEALPGPYVRAFPEDLAFLGIRVANATAHEQAPWDWVLVPPAVFDAQFPHLAGQATMAVLPADRTAPDGLLGTPVPAAARFYEQGAAQVASSIHFVVLAMGLSVGVFAGGVLRLEVLARERDLATLQAIGGAAAARRAVVLRTLFLVGLGVAFGTVAGLLLAGVASRALGADAVALDPWFVLEVAVVALTAGALAGIAGGLRHLARPLGGRLGRRGLSARRFPGPVRFLLVTPRLLPSAVAAALVLGSISSVVLAAASVPFTVLDPQDGTHTVGRAPDNPFRGTADRFFGEHATLFPGIEGSSPETLAPTVLQGRPVAVRGVSPEGWRSVDAVRLVRGAWPASPDEATAGTRLAAAAGLGVGDTVVVPGAYRTTLRAFSITGIHAGAGLLDDELVTGLDAAADLAGMPPGQVHFIRLRGNASQVDAALGADRPVVLSLRIDPPEPVPRTLAVAEVHLVNVLPRPSSRTLALRVDGVLAADTVATVAGRSEAVVRLPFAVPAQPHFLVEVNPSVNVTTAAPGLVVRAPESVPPNTTFEVVVTTPAGAPAEGATVEARALAFTADGRGAVAVDSGPPGALSLRARLGDAVGGATVYVVAPEQALSAFVVATRAVILDTLTLNETTRQYTLLVSFANLGGAPFNGTVEARHGETEAGNVTLRLAARADTSAVLQARVPANASTLDLPGLRVDLPGAAEAGTPPPSPGSAPAPEPRPVEQVPRTVAQVLAEKRRALTEGTATRGLDPRGFLEDVFANLEQSVSLVLLATFVHAGAGVVVAVLREGRERAEVQEVLRHLGAGPDLLATRAARDALLAALPGLLLGALLAWAGLAALQPFGFPAAFGHTIPAGAAADVYLRVVAGLAVVAALTAAWSTRLPPEAPLRQVPPVPLRTLLEARR